MSSIIQMEQSFIMIKPDALRRGIVDEIRSQLLVSGLVVTHSSNITFTREKLFGLWPNIYGLDHIQKSVDYLCGHTLPVWIVMGENAISVVCNFKKRIRKEFNCRGFETLIHCPDDANDCARELVVLLINSP